MYCVMFIRANTFNLFLAYIGVHIQIWSRYISYLTDGTYKLIPITYTYTKQMSCGFNIQIGIHFVINKFENILL